jgi:hypothetical protein
VRNKALSFLLSSLAGVLIAGLVIMLASCGHSAQKGEKTAPLVANAKSIQENLINPRCVRCHGTSNAAAGVVLTDIADALKRKVRVGGEHDHKPLLLVPGCAGRSLLYLVARDRKMPPPEAGLPTFSADELKIVETWIASEGKACGPDKSEPGTPDEPLDPGGP